jgi:hypothetical protein
MRLGRWSVSNGAHFDGRHNGARIGEAERGNTEAQPRIGAVARIHQHDAGRGMVRCRVLSEAHPVQGFLSNTNPDHAFDRPCQRTLRTLLGR